MKTIGVAMIVKNATPTLPFCLESVRGVASQIVVGDTGSSDETPEIARAHGATVVSVPWEDHFANARNSVLEHMTTDWVLALDPDEELDAAAKELLPALLESGEISAYSVIHRLYMRSATSHSMEILATPSHSPMERAREAGSYHDLPKVRIFRRDPRIYFFGRVHELLEYRLCALNLAFPPTDVVIHNFGYLHDSPEVRAQKDQYYRWLGHIRIEEEADNPLAWFDLGKLEYQSFHNFEFALSCFASATRLHPPFTRAWLFAAEIHIQIGQAKEALAALAHADSTGEAPLWRERVRGDAFLKLGQAAAAKAAYERALQIGGADPLVSSRLGYSEVLLGETSSGLRKLHQAVDLMPHQIAGHDLLIKAYIFVGDLPCAAVAAERFAAYIGHPKIFLRAASIRAQLEQWKAARALVARGLALFPESTELRNAEAELGRKLLQRAATGAMP